MIPQPVRRIGVVAALAVLAVPLLIGTGSAPAAAATSPTTLAWPGDTTVHDADRSNDLGGNLSGLAAVTTAAGPRLWAVRDNPSELLLLEPNGATWRAADGWQDGRALRFPTGSGAPDAEGVTTLGGVDGAVYVAAERDNDRPGTARNVVLRYDTDGATVPDTDGDTDGPLAAAAVWELDGLLAGTSANTGIEGIAWVPDDVLVAAGLHDGGGRPYDPAAYPGHGDGLFVIGVEATGSLAVVALAEGRPASLVTTVASGQAAVMDVVYDPANRALWALCDDRCGGVTSVLTADPATHTFVPRVLVAPPAQLARRNNEGLAFATPDGCAAASTAVYFADDSAGDDHALRRAMLACADVARALSTNGSPATAGTVPPTTTTASPASSTPATGSTATTAEPATTPTTTPTTGDAGGSISASVDDPSNSGAGAQTLVLGGAVAVAVVVFVSGAVIWSRRRSR